MTQVKKRRLTDATKVEVYNNTSGGVAFHADGRKYRWDMPDTRRDVPLSALRELTFTLGGLELLSECLLIRDFDVREDLGLPVDKDQVMGKEEVLDLLSNKSTDELERVLSSTHNGIREKIADTAIAQRITDTDKMEVIEEYTGIDVYKVIQDAKEEEREQKKEKAAASKKAKSATKDK